VIHVVLELVTDNFGSALNEEVWKPGCMRSYLRLGVKILHKLTFQGGTTDLKSASKSNRQQLPVECTPFLDITKR
jgi:hypothetical protein